MVLDLLISAVYQLVRNTWELSVFVVKFFLAAILLELIYRRELDPEGFTDRLVEYGRPAVTAIVIGGAVLALTGVELPIRYRLFSEMVAVGYFGFLFWKY